MPQRFLRPGITTSDAWNSVSYEAQSFFVRILTLVDDFGRYDGRTPVLHGQCFALRDDITCKKTAALRSELHAAGLVIVYLHEGKEFIQVQKWQERTRSAQSKYPTPPIPQESAADGSEPQEKGASIAIAIATTSSPLQGSQAVAWSPAEQWTGITDEDKQRWGLAYPACDIERQLLSMGEWLLANPTQRKSNYRKFITNWLSRSQDKGGDKGRPVNASNGHRSYTPPHKRDAGL